MKLFERIFLYTILAILVFYVFLADNNVESQGVIQEEIRARRISIVNDEGREVISLFTNAENNGVVMIYNKNGNPAVGMTVSNTGGAIPVYNKDGKVVASILADRNYNGELIVWNKSGYRAASMVANENYDGEITIYNMGADKDESSGGMFIYNKAGSCCVDIHTSEEGGKMIVANKDGKPVAGMIVNENDNGEIRVYDKNGKGIGSLP